MPLRKASKAIFKGKELIIKRYINPPSLLYFVRPSVRHLLYSPDAISLYL